MKKRRSTTTVRVAILAMVAVVGSLLASASLAGAADEPSAEVLPRTSACVGAALDSFGFEDVDGLSPERQDAINCIAYYGVTTGKTATVFDPDSNVTRSQMTLFLHRAADIAGVDFALTADDPDARFSDIGDLNEDRRAAIRDLYGKGIMSGRNTDARSAVGSASSETFVPDEPINRAEMAIYLRNLVRAASPDLFDSDGELIGVTDLDSFTDARDTTPAATSDAIATIYELGITVGQSAAIYDPLGFVRRGNMALFLARTLAHTTAQPAGLDVQKDGTTLVVSLRDRHFQPIEDQYDRYVDVFVADAENADHAFNSDGSCDEDVVREAPRYFHDACIIDVGDAQTDGGVAVIDLGDDLTRDGLAVWVWYGSLGDEADEAAVVLVEFDPDDLPPPVPSQLTVTFTGLRSQPDGSTVMTARTGATVRVNLQLQGNYADEEDLDNADTPAGGATYELVLVTTVPDGSDTDDDRDVYERARAEDIELNANGSATFTLPVHRIDDYAVEYALTPVGNTVFPDPATGTVSFVNTDPVPSGGRSRSAGQVAASRRCRR